MVITLVIDMFNVTNNGTTVSAIRFAKELTKRGHTVRVLTTGDPSESGIDPANGLHMYYVPELYIPVATYFAAKQGTFFGKPVKTIVTSAIEGADIVHIYQSWPLDGMARKIAKKLGVPAVAAFHMQPENITYNIGLSWFKPLAHLIYYILYIGFYRHFEHIHCPSAFIATELRKHGYKAKLHIISNGVHHDFFDTLIPPKTDDGIFRILMVGRLSKEKRQDVLIKAVQKSKYKDKIQLYFAGTGPKEKVYRKMGATLPKPPIFGYYSKQELISLIHSCDLYVHPSDIEIEGISCMEAFCAGLIPIISDSKLSATKQFALCKESLFRHGNPASLAERIDYWVENPERREYMSKSYINYGKSLSLEESVKKMERVYNAAIEGGKNEYYHGRIFRFFSRLLYTIIAVPVLYVWLKFVNGVRISGTKNLKSLKGGYLTVCNHVHRLDCVMVSMAIYPRKLIFPTIPENIDRWFPGIFVHLLGGEPVPRSLKDTGLFFDEMELYLLKGRVVHFFPEGELKPYDTNIYEFKKGAFHLAARARVPVVPMTIFFRKPNGLYKLFKRKPLMTLTVGEAIYPVSTDIKEDGRIRMEKTHEQMVELQA